MERPPVGFHYRSGLAPRKNFPVRPRWIRMHFSSEVRAVSVVVVVMVVVAGALVGVVGVVRVVRVE